jgi:hypothetical protein
MSDISEKFEELRAKLLTLEKRETELTKRVDRIVGKLDAFDPEINALMREGLPLDLFTRVALLTNKYDVHGYYPYHLINLDGTKVERSIDIYASREGIYTVPEGEGARAGQSWPERNNLLVECKQRRENVRWLFCFLPTSEKEWSVAGKEVPIVNAGFELRPSNEGFQSAANPKDVKNAIAQLNEAYIPFLVNREKEPKPGQRGLDEREKKFGEHTWLLLVTNSTLKVFQPPESFEELLKNEASANDLFTEVPWLVFKPDATLALMLHQMEAVADLSTAEDCKPSIPHLLAEDAHEVHIVNFKYLSEFLTLVEDPPRIKSISISLNVNGDPESTFTIK